MTDQMNRVDSLSTWYMQQQSKFDRRLIGFRYRTLRPHLRCPYGLELGSAEGEMAQFFVHDFEHLTIVEGATELLDHVAEAPNLTKIHALFEGVEPKCKYR